MSEPDSADDEALRRADASAELFVRSPHLARCIVCRGELMFSERRVHRGACAKARKTALQKWRRQRARAVRA